ncbi:Testis-expressed protein [Ooceraea biroi]|nr:Testis-expressed protein [Ooceraea biroi]
MFHITTLQSTTCDISVMKMVRCFRTTARSSRNVTSTSPISSHGGFNEYYRNLLQQFANHCQTSNRDVTDPDWLVYQRNEQNAELSKKKNNKEKPEYSQVIPGIPHVQSSEILEIGPVAGAENRYLELISAEWRNTKVSLKRHTFKGCQDAIRADMEVLSEIRHPNILLLMATTHTNEHGLVSVFEPVHCTLYNYIHVQGERMNIQGTIQIGIRLADALKYCHMRGYVHGGISSHCVYLTSDATVKLGGWELARKAENINIERDFDKYLKIEIDKWHAPETSYGHLYSTKKSDVYCLMLLLWEICTGCVPCDGSDRSDVEPEYVTRNRSVSLRNVPSLLRKLLETGLQSDVANRTLDMDKIGRELHRLLVIHECEKKSANESETNNNDSSYLKHEDILNMKTSSPVSSTKTKVDANSSHSPATKSKESIHQFFTPGKQQRNNGDSISKDGTEKPGTPAIGNGIAKDSASCTNCAEIFNIVQDIDEGSNARADLKRLKQLIASRRKRFFLGTDSPSSETNSKVTNAPSLKKSSSCDYITCKPASHTTAIEPRFNRSLNDFDGSTSKSSSWTLQRKPPYMTMPACIKDAIVQRQVLHPDTKSFYESILWRKEKEICLSRMGRDSKKKDEKISSSLQRCVNNGLSIIGEDKAQSPRQAATHINDTFIIETAAKDNNIEDTEESVSRDVKNASTRLPSANKSIQDLKNALERATEIIRSITPTRVNDFDLGEKQECESAYEDLYSSEDIPVTERSTSDKSFSYTNGHASTESIEATEGRRDFNQTPSSVNEDKKLNSLKITFTRTSKTSPKPTQNKQSTDSQEAGRKNETVLANGTAAIRQRTKADFHEERYANVSLPLNNVRKISAQRSVSWPSRLNPVKTDCLKAARKSDPPSTRCITEDLYIDDEFENTNLNYNLVLLGDDYEYLTDSVSLDDQRLLQSTEL